MSFLYGKQWIYGNVSPPVLFSVQYTAILNLCISVFIYWKQTTRACLL